jgi:tetratricopeptide (TPR) repeat protein/tRNA A-37 threonylcarbamoyl transferase component Bud32
MADENPDGMDRDPETPPNELEATQIGGTDDLDDSAANGRNRSILNSLDRSLGHVPRVMLRDEGQDGDDPIVQPHSPEIPLRTAEDRYQLLGEIARGGMGAILKGRDNDLGRDLAVKVLLESHKDKPEVIQRFVEEAQIGGQLQHPGIAPVYELGQFRDRRPFFTMKLIKGKTLATLLAERNRPTDDRTKFLGIFEQVCQTMAYAHSRGVIHRDLKPSNIMVGAFGEVQVMDWGLAKVMSEGGVADEKKAQTRQQDISVIETLRSTDSDLPGSFGSQTQMGSILGTPAYMAPEQALGEVDRLDQRTDVFGLGAILCEILTGQPPYIGEDGQAVFRLAARAKLDDCFARLESCGADSDLVELVRNCLESEPDDRPRDAGVLAQQVTQYLESVETRLQEAEVARAAESARAEEERKRRRVTLALAASVLFMICVGGGSWVWWEQQRAERRSVATARVNEAVHEARLHRDLADEGDLARRFQELHIAVGNAEQAVKLADEDEVAADTRRNAKALLADLKTELSTAREQVEQAAADRALQERLDHIRLSQAGGADQRSSATYSRGWSNLATVEIFDLVSAAEQYEEAFRGAGMDVLKHEVADLAARIDQSAIRESLIGALDNWARALKQGQQDQQNLRLKLLAIADASDPSPWRKQLRAALSAGDIDRLQQLASDEEAGRQSPELIAWIGAALREAERFDESIAVLQKGQEEHPGDFWLNFELSRSLAKQGEPFDGLEYLRAAMAVRPDSTNLRFALAHSLFKAERYDESSRIFLELLQDHPRDAYLQYRYALLLGTQKKLDEAAVEYRKVIELDPEFTAAYNNLGTILFRKKKLNEALSMFQKVLQIDPDHVFATQNMGDVLKRQGKWDEAFALFQRAIELDPKFVRAYNASGIVLEHQGQQDEAAAAYQQAIEVDPNYAPAHVNLGRIWDLRKNYEKAALHYRKALELDPDLSHAHSGFANVLLGQQKLDEAVVHYNKAIELDSERAVTHFNLGVALYRQGKLEDAITQYERVLEIDPEYESVQRELPRTCHERAWSLVCQPDTSEEDATRALAFARRACEFAPRNRDYLTTLGVACYRTGDWKSAREALEQSLELRRNHPFNWLPLAMTCWQLGDRDEARTWYDKAVQWRKKRKPNEVIQGFFEEAEKLLEPRPDKENSSQDQKSESPQSSTTSDPMSDNQRESLMD